MFFLKDKGQFMLRKILSLAIISYFIVTSSDVHAVSENIELSTSAGYSNLNSFEFDKTASLFKPFHGFHLELDGFYNFNSNDLPVIFTTGIGIKYLQASSKNNQPNIEYVKSTETTLSFTSIPVYAGIKTNFSDIPFDLYLLGDIGYDFSDSIKVSMESNTEFVKYVNSNTEYKIKNHYYYGIKFVSLYKISLNFSLGMHLNYNRHYMILDYISKSVTYSESTHFNEISTGLTMNYIF